MLQIKPAISVVMSVYNTDRYLRESINSILEQSFDNFEFIIVNDGSTDSSLEILRSFSDPRIRLITQENQGLPTALKKAISLAQGRFIARMDADDISLPNRLSLQYGYFQAHPEIDIVGGQAWMISSEGTIIAEIKKPLSAGNIERYMEYACPLLHPTYMIKAEVYRSLGFYRAFLYPAEDYDFLLRASEAGYRLANVPEKILLYRLNPKGISSGSARCMLRFTRMILKLHRQRRIGKSGGDNLITQLEEESCRSSFWFDLWYDARKMFLVRSKRHNGVHKYFFLLMVALTSIMHYEIFLSSWRGVFSTKWIDH